MSRADLTVMCVLMCSVIGCEGSPSPAVTAPARAAEPARPDPKVLRLPLAQRLLREGEQRPSLGVRGEDLRRGIEARGVHLVRTRQVLAEPLEAAYCEVSLSGAGLSISLCEFVDHAAAELGLARSRAMFDGLIRDRLLIVHENALLTLAGESEDGRACQERQLVTRTFQTLTPRRPRAI